MIDATTGSTAVDIGIVAMLLWIIDRLIKSKFPNFNNKPKAQWPIDLLEEMRRHNMQEEIHLKEIKDNLSIFITQEQRRFEREIEYRTQIKESLKAVHKRLDEGRK